MPRFRVVITRPLVVDGVVRLAWKLNHAYANRRAAIFRNRWLGIAYVDTCPLGGSPSPASHIHQFCRDEVVILVSCIGSELARGASEKLYRQPATGGVGGAGRKREV